jgi:hypothetical protein
MAVLDRSVDVCFRSVMCGDEVLASIPDRAVDRRVVMLTADRPESDILGTGFDD